ncbi:MAG: GHKL domain-containing protein [Lachnospiraceae bacterium]|nr:GHKL domain-containing protein [Lachnospiraceae bacterium]
MSMLYVAIEFLASFTELYVAYLVLSTIFKDRRKSENLRADVIMAIIGTLMVLLCNRIELFSYFTIIIVSIYLSVSAKLIYKLNCITIFSVISFYLLCMNSFDFLALTLISHFYQGSETLLQIISGIGPIRAMVISAIKIMWVIMYACIKRVLQKIPVNIKGAYFILLTSGIGFCGFVFLSNQAVKAFNDTMPVMWFVIICFLASIIFGFYYVIMRREEKLKMNFLEMRNKLLRDNYDSLNEIYMNNSKMYHDLNDHLNVLYQLLNGENIAEAKAYIKEISKPILSLSKTVWTGVDVVDVVINSKVQRMDELKILSDINVEFPKSSNILPSDLCTILSNLLDNAIEEVERLKENKKISLTIRRVNCFLFIKVINPCNEGKKFDIFPSTTKENKILHGWGLQSVGDVVRKYNGTMECINEDREFIVKVMLPFDQEL